MTISTYDLPEEEVQLFEMHNEGGHTGEDISVSVPYVLKDKTFLSPGTWNTYDYKPEAIKRIYDNTTWNDETTALYYDHNSRSAANWLGEVKNVRFEDGRVIGDVYIVDRDAATKLKYGAKWGISPKIKLYCVPNSSTVHTGMFLDFSVVKTPAVKTATLNNSMIEMPEGDLAVILNSEVYQEPSMDQNSLESKVKEFIKTHPNPDDVSVHNFAVSIGVLPDKVEEVLYRLATSFLKGSAGTENSESVKTGGRDQPDSAFDAEQIKKGIEVEKEHTDVLDEAKAIAKDHLAENPKYYDYLDKMEKQMNIDSKTKMATDIKEEPKIEKDLKAPVAPVDEAAKKPEVYPNPAGDKKEEYPSPVEKDAKVPVVPEDKDKEEDKKEEEEMSLEELYSIFSDAKFASFKEQYMAQNACSIKDAAKAYKGKKGMMDLEEKFNKKFAELSSKIDSAKTVSVERSTFSTDSSAVNQPIDMARIEAASKDVELADALLGEVLLAIDEGRY